MKILIIGERFSANLGDPIICESVAYLIKEEFKSAQIYFLDLSARPAYPNEASSQSSLKKSRFSGLIKKVSLALTKIGLDSEYLIYKRMHGDKEAYYQEIIEQADFDLAVFAGGQMFLDYFVFPIYQLASYLKSKQVPLIFNAVGYGQIASPKMQKLLQTALSFDNVSFISARDDLASVQALAGKKKIKASFDPALWAREVYQVDKQESSVIGLGVLYAHNMNYQEMLNFWTKLIKEIEAANLKWQLFTNGAPNDQAFAQAILKNLNFQKEDFHLYLKPRPQRPQDLVQTIAGFKAIISFRLHSHVLAAALGLPSLALVWDQKIRYFFDTINLSERVFELKAGPQEILQALERALAQEADSSLIDQQKIHLQELLLGAIQEGLQHV